MALVIKAELARLANCSRPIPGDWVKKGKLDMVDGSDLIDTTAPKTLEFFRAMAIKNGKAAIETYTNPSELINPGDQLALSNESKEAIAGTVEDYGKEKTKVAKETAIKLKLANTTTRGHLIEYDLVEQYIFLWIDTLHSNLERMSSGFWDDLSRRLLLAGENKPEFKLDWTDKIKLIKHETKMAAMERLAGIKKIQAEGGK